MTAKLLRTKDCASVIVDKDSYFAYGKNNKLTGKIRTITDRPRYKKK